MWRTNFNNEDVSNYELAAAAKSLCSCLTLCDPIDGSPPGSPIPGILQAKTLDWVAISFSKAWKWKVKVKSLSHFQLLATPWTAVQQAPLSMGFSRREYWSGLPLPSPMNLLGAHKWWGLMTDMRFGQVKFICNLSKNVLVSGGNKAWLVWSSWEWDGKIKVETRDHLKKIALQREREKWGSFWRDMQNSKEGL